MSYIFSFLTSLRLPSSASVFPSSSGSSMIVQQRLRQHADTQWCETKDKASACNANCCLLNSLHGAQTRYRLQINVFIHSDWLKNKSGVLVCTRKNKHDVEGCALDIVSCCCCESSARRPQWSCDSWSWRQVFVLSQQPEKPSSAGTVANTFILPFCFFHNGFNGHQKYAHLILS